MGSGSTLTPSGEPLLSVRGLRRLHVGPLDLELHAGEALCITGASGSGKSLLLRALADLDPHDGDVRLDGVPQASIPGPDWRRQVALLGSESHWWAPQVRDHFVAHRLPDFRTVGFDDDPSLWAVERLSSGERQRLALLRVLALEPRVLLLDEPTANLDEDNAERIERLIGAWRRDTGGGVVWVSHAMEQVRRVCARHVEMDNGRWKQAA